MRLFLSLDLAAPCGSPPRLPSKAQQSTSGDACCWTAQLPHRHLLQLSDPSSTGGYLTWSSQNLPITLGGCNADTLPPLAKQAICRRLLTSCMHAFSAYASICGHNNCIMQMLSHESVCSNSKSCTQGAHDCLLVQGMYWLDQTAKHPATVMIDPEGLASGKTRVTQGSPIDGL